MPCMDKVWVVFFPTENDNIQLICLAYHKRGYVYAYDGISVVGLCVMLRW